MTHLEYSELKHKLNSRRLQHYFIGFLASLSLSPITGLLLGFLICENLYSLGQYLISVYTTFLIGLMVTYFFDFWSSERLDEMFDINRSYEDALKSLKLDYKPPKK